MLTETRKLFSSKSPNTYKNMRFSINNEYLKLLRINHWFKNFFIFFGIFFAVWRIGIPFQRSIIFDAVFAFFASSLVSSSNYVINQIADIKYDRLHPKKRNRPLAASKISAFRALIISIAIFVLVFIISFRYYSIQFVSSLSVLWIAGLFYNIEPLRLKDKFLIDVLSESINNPIRFLVGWYVLPVTTFPNVLLLLFTWTFGAVLMTAKRYDEILVHGKDLIRYRNTFNYYNKNLLSKLTYLYEIVSLIVFTIFSISISIKLVIGILPITLFYVWFNRQVFSGKAEARFIEKFVFSGQFLIVSTLLLIIFYFLVFK